MTLFAWAMGMPVARAEARATGCECALWSSWWVVVVLLVVAAKGGVDAKGLAASAWLMKWS